VSGENVIKVPESVDDESATLAEPLSCAINAQQLAGLGSGDKVLIIGGGPLGALHAALAKAIGAADVAVVERSELRLSLLGKIEGLTVIDGVHEDVSQVVSERTSGLGADVVIVCAPTRQAQEDSLQYARKGGAISFFASLPKGDADITLDSRAIHYGELRILGASDSRPEHVRRAIELMAGGKIDLRGIVTHRVSLDDIHEGLELMKSQQSLKVIVYPSRRLL
jgi:L-iditol 2-dehydrogenase